MADRRTGAALAATAVGLLAFVAALGAIVWGLNLAVATSDLEPAGPTCAYEIDPGSGTAGYGTERLRLGLWPTRECVTSDGRVYSGAAVNSTNPLEVKPLEAENAPWWLGTAALATVAAACVGSAAGHYTARWTNRRRPAPRQPEPAGTGGA